LKYSKVILIIAAVAVLAFLAVILPVNELIVALQNWAKADPSYAAVVVTFALAIGFLLLLPASVLMMSAGLLFGLVKGMAVVWLAGFTASTLAFLVGRTVGREWIERGIRRQGLFTAIDRAIRRKGFSVVLLTRVAMLPFPWLNYALGVTSVRLRDYVAGTSIGMLLPYFLFVYLGTTVSSVAAILNGNVHLEREQWITGALVLTAALAVIILVLRAASRVLREELAEAAGDPGSGPG
jgi:uncharacterized membrane protein YdjX (TVP38/TMEM64 family)